MNPRRTRHRDRIWKVRKSGQPADDSVSSHSRGRGGCTCWKREKMNKVFAVGVGPGSPKYVTDIVKEAISQDTY